MRSTSVVPFNLRSETLGFDTVKPWSSDALRLLFSVPRVFDPLAQAWNRRYPGTLSALERLTEMGFIVYQPRIVLDTLTGESVDRAGRPVPRYRTTARGVELLRRLREDSRELAEEFPKTSPTNRLGVLELIEAANVSVKAAPYGVSGEFLRAASRLSERSCRWWVARLVEKGYLRRLPFQVADRREVLPGHWRATRVLSRQMLEICKQQLPGVSASMVEEYRLRRTRFLDDVDPRRIGLSGATDYDHDLQTQNLIAELLRSPRFRSDGLFGVEPAFKLGVDTSTHPWRFGGEEDFVIYQPDTQFRESGSEGWVRTVLEYERRQTRRDGWFHIERFCGWLRESVGGWETVYLRFVVDSEQRARSYAELLAAYADWVTKHPAYAPTQKVTLFVTSSKRIREADDPLHSDIWWRVGMPTGDGQAVLHPHRDSPYDRYFRVASRGVQIGPDN